MENGIICTNYKYALLDSDELGMFLTACCIPPIKLYEPSVSNEPPDRATFGEL